MSACRTRSVFSLLLIDHPTTFRENRSITTHRYSQPSAVAMYVMSDSHASFLDATSNSRFSRSSTTFKP
jgi:hypothetical protein